MGKFLILKRLAVIKGTSTITLNKNESLINSGMAISGGC